MSKSKKSNSLPNHSFEEVERIGLEPITLTLPVLRSSQMS